MVALIEVRFFFMKMIPKLVVFPPDGAAYSFFICNAVIICKNALIVGQKRNTSKFNLNKYNNFKIKLLKKN